MEGGGEEQHGHVAHLPEYPHPPVSVQQPQYGMPVQLPALSQANRDARKERKNANSRSRAARLKKRITELKAKDAEELTEEEKQLLRNFEQKRERKNNRSKERAIEKKTEVERILKKTVSRRTQKERK
eukprot:CAMPEP_0195300342 /NCGR_PEP_ID=MMETSP0707-20130614/27255_1 /TAXON_ID=33640 /ORGANISM="Asterionellopsis glacialis, Strain CCMP134" /LENGTH=127 /DNA_ID=CAMNT_0040363011 /DNA_START=139 /DNA_END=519 /DNA_ORIENTATION=-